MPTDEKRELLRHSLATVVYRGGKALRDAPPAFAGFRVGERSRTPVEVLAHVNDLFAWALWLAKGSHTWHESTPAAWDEEVAQFYRGIAAFDAYLASDEPLGSSAERLFQGPIADALTHVGQLTMLRRLAGSPVKGENYAKADIAAGRVGPAQSAPRVEFG